MNCCGNCFKDPSLKNIIVSKSVNAGKCDFCEQEGAPIVPCASLSENFEVLFELYTPHPNVTKSLKKDEPRFIFEHLNEYWPGLFNKSLLNRQKIKFLVDSIGRGWENFDDKLFQSPVDFKESIFEHPKNTGSLELQWDSFANAIKTKNRFFLSEKLDTDLLQSIFERLTKTYKPGHLFYRCRISNEPLIASELGKPPIDKTTAGRANPVGIPYLYLSNDEKTTLYETRVGLHENISIGKFISNEPINLISLTKISLLGPFHILEKDFTIEEFIRFRPYLEKLESELSKPIRKQDEQLDYLPTQFLCEYVRFMGFDAVEYKSAMDSNGINVALFNDRKVDCVEVKSYTVDNLEYNWV